MAEVPPIDSKIDDLYKRPLADFVKGRNELARTLDGDEARRVKALRKPTVVPWAVNQVYWHARPTYDRLSSAGDKLRAAQLAALKGRSADLRAASDAHRKAIGAAVKEASRLAAAAGVHPSPEELARTFEAVSLARELPEPPGRLTTALQPAGFEALAGVPVKTRPAAEIAREEARTETEQKIRADLARQKERAIGQARKKVERAREAEERARSAWERAKRELNAAELQLSEVE
jgi:hypothetical protein